MKQSKTAKAVVIATVVGVICLIVCLVRLLANKDADAGELDDII